MGKPKLYPMNFGMSESEEVEINTMIEVAGDGCGVMTTKVSHFNLLVL